MSDNNINLTPEQLKTLALMITKLDSPEKIDRFFKLIEHQELLLVIVEKERNWTWLKKSAKDLALYVTAISAGLYAAYKFWVDFIMLTISKKG